MAKRLDDIDREIAQLKARRAQLQAAETRERRNLRTRQAVILGGWLLANEPATAQRIVSALKRPQDLSAFDQAQRAHQDESEVVHEEPAPSGP